MIFPESSVKVYKVNTILGNTCLGDRYREPGIECLSCLDVKVDRLSHEVFSKFAVVVSSLPRKMRRFAGELSKAFSPFLFP